MITREGLARALVCLTLALPACSDDSPADGDTGSESADTDPTGDGDNDNGDGDGDGDGDCMIGGDITDAMFCTRSANCADFAAVYFSNISDVQNGTMWMGNLEVSVADGRCTFTTNGIPNHDFNATGNFATPVAEVQGSYEVTTTPAPANAVTDLVLGDNALFLNGVKLDLLAAACFGVGNEPLGNEKIGCFQDQIDNPWRYDPMSPLNNFGTDEHNAHTQPTGAYHYHGNPLAMFEQDCAGADGPSPTIGFAADGYPIYGKCIDDGGTIRAVTSSFQLKQGVRQEVPGYTTPTVTGGVVSDEYNGQFLGDYEYVAGSGDLDECNGMEVDGQYGYYVTDSFPWVMKCYKGTPGDTWPAGGAMPPGPP